MAKPHPQSDKTIRAYLCSADDAEDTRIVFAKSNGAARFPYARDLDWDFREVTVRRAPEFDGFAPGPVPASALLEHGWRVECSHCYRMLSFDDSYIEDYTRADMEDWARRNAPHIEALERFDRDTPKPAEVSATATHRERWVAERHKEEWQRARYDLSSRIAPELLSRKGLRLHDDTGQCFCNASCEQQAITARAALNLQHQRAEEEAARRFPGCEDYASNGWPYLTPSVTFKVPNCIHPVSWKPDQAEPWIAECDTEAWNAYKTQLHEEKSGQAQDQTAA
jgi:hypothetical protein